MWLCERSTRTVMEAGYCTALTHFAFSLAREEVERLTESFSALILLPLSDITPSGVQIAICSHSV